MPRKPRAAPKPTPNAAPLRGAALAVACAGADDRMTLPERVGVCTPEIVELTATGDGLIVPTEVILAEAEEDLDAAFDADGVGVGVGVGVAETTAGYATGSRFFTSDGRAWYHAGVLPAFNDEVISAAKADGDATA